MSNIGLIRSIFAVAALYDGVFGIAFLFATGAVFRLFGVTPPNHPGYAQFPAALLLTFALMFLAVARDPAANRNLIPYGMLLKVAYCGVVLYYWMTRGIPDMWKPWALVDLVFLALFAWAYAAIRPATRPAAAVA